MLARYSSRNPGELAARLLRRMKQGLGLAEGAFPDHRESPPVAESYFVGVMIPLYREKLNLRYQRELRSWTSLLDLLARREYGRAADVAAQRVKALEQSVVDGGWHRAQFLELIQPEGASLLDRQEEAYLTREAEAAGRRAPPMLALPAWGESHPAPGIPAPPKGGGKGKSKGKKGKQAGQ